MSRRFGQHDRFKQLVVGSRCRIGAERVVVRNCDRGLAAGAAWIQIKNRYAVAGARIAASRPDRVFQRIRARLGECSRSFPGKRAIVLRDDFGLWRAAVGVDAISVEWRIGSAATGIK
jgi:hypothetical protein